MLLIPQRKFKMKNHTEHDLKRLGFKQCKNNPELYKVSFTVLKYNNNPVLYCETIVDSENGSVKIDVYDSQCGDTWHHFYSNAFGGNSSLVTKINHKIVQRLYYKYRIKEVVHRER